VSVKVPCGSATVVDVGVVSVSTGTLWPVRFACVVFAVPVGFWVRDRRGGPGEAEAAGVTTRSVSVRIRSLES
jgi:hypothetical protein